MKLENLPMSAVEHNSSRGPHSKEVPHAEKSTENKPYCSPDLALEGWGWEFRSNVVLSRRDASNPT